MLDNFRVSKAVGIIYGLLIILLLITITTYFYLSKRPASDTQTATPSVSTPAANKETLEQIATQSIQPQNEETPASNYEGLVDESLLKQPINDDPALIKDELHQLKDIQGQLNEQEGILNKQHQDADKLIELKEQQIADMEKQLQAQQK